MDWKLFIARRIYRSNEGGKEVSKPAVRIAMLGIAIGLAVMIVSVAVVIGFKHEVRDKVVGLGSDIVITNFDSPAILSDGSHRCQRQFAPSVENTGRSEARAALFHQAGNDYDRRQLSGNGTERCFS